MDQFMLLKPLRSQSECKDSEVSDICKATIENICVVNVSALLLVGNVLGVGQISQMTAIIARAPTFMLA